MSITDVPEPSSLFALAGFLPGLALCAARSRAAQPDYDSAAGVSGLRFLFVLCASYAYPGVDNTEFLG